MNKLREKIRTFSFDGEGIYEMLAHTGMYVLRTDYDALERAVAELREYATHNRECASICRSGRDPIYCTCGLDSILARLDAEGEGK